MNLWPSSPITCAVKSVHNTALDIYMFTILVKHFPEIDLSLTTNLVRQFYGGGYQLPFRDLHIGNNNLMISDMEWKFSRDFNLGPIKAYP